MDRFELMDAFVRAVEKGSLTAAAKELGTTQPTVSKWLSALEKHVGARLLHRDTQGLRLTDAGQCYFSATKQILSDLERAAFDAKGLRQEVKGTLRINTSVSLGETWLCPIALDFQALYPGLKVKLTCDDARSNLVEQRIDVAVRMGLVGNDSLVAKALGGASYVLAASPAYLKKHGTPKKPEQLGQHNYLFYGGTWQERLCTPDGIITVSVQNDFQVNSVRAVRLAGLKDAGIIRVKRWLVADDLDKGTLVEVLPGVAPAAEPAYAIYLPSPQQPQKVKAFVAYLQKRIVEVPGWVPPDKIPPYNPYDGAPWPTGDMFPDRQ